MTAIPAAAERARPAYTIQGREVSLPVRVRDASSAAATFLVPSAAVQRLIPDAAFDVPELLPGRALCSLAAIEYRDNDLGVYNEVSIAFFVREKGSGGLPYLGLALDFARGNVATYIHRLPVNAAFTCEGGRTIWGFPKTVEQIEITKAVARVTCTLVCNGAHVLTLSMPRGGNRILAEAPMTTYSFIDGVPHRTRFTSGGSGAGFRLGGAELSLGDHPIAEELRALGLPKHAIMTMWMEKMTGCFDAPERL